MPDAAGLHARPAAALARALTQSGLDLHVRNVDADGERVSASSVLALLSLGAAQGHRLAFSCAPARRGEAVAILTGIFGDAFEPSEASEPSEADG